MQDVELDPGCAGSVVRVIWSNDKAKRIGIIQNDRDCFYAIYEEICAFDEDDWIAFGSALNRYPAWWSPVSSSINSNSFYDSEDKLLREIKSSYEYRTYFE